MKRNLAKKLAKMRVPASLVKDAINYDLQQEDGRLVVSDGRVGLKALWAAEDSLARSLRRLATATPAKELSTELADEIFGKEENSNLHADQIRGVRAVCAAPVSVITGGPGCGKTRVTKVVLDLVETAGLSVRCCAPTGKAAQRMKELTGRDASTIHRLLSSLYDPTTQERKQIQDDVIIIDEFSMVSTQLASELFHWMRTGMRIVIVGDVDQLPSIDAGRVLYDVIQSNLVPVTRLTKIFRQASESRIPWIAQSLNRGEIPADIEQKGAGFAFIQVQDEEVSSPSDDLYGDLLSEDSSSDTQQPAMNAVLSAAVAGATKHLPEVYGFAPHEIVVLAPMRVRACGVNALNAEIQNVLNPCKDPQADIWGLNRQALRMGDRVIHKQNNYNLGIFNGEVGVVVAVDQAGLAADYLKTLKVASESSEEKVVLVAQYADPGSESGSKFIGYRASDARGCLDLAYASTVHSYQGSQARAVLMLCTRSQTWMNTRAIIYTGLTRAVEYVGIIGQLDTLAAAVRERRGSERKTRLFELLTQPNAAGQKG